MHGDSRETAIIVYTRIKASKTNNHTTTCVGHQHTEDEVNKTKHT